MNLLMWLTSHMALAKIVSCVFSLSILVIVVKGVHRNLQVGHCSYLLETGVQREQFLTVKKQVENFCHALFTRIAWPSLTCFQQHYTLKSLALRTQTTYREHDLDISERHSTLTSMKGVTTSMVKGVHVGPS